MAGSSPEEKIFVWGDEPMIYALAKRKPAGRYTVRYHILEFGAQKQTADLLRSEPPRYVVSFGQEKELPGLQVLLTEKYIPEGSVERQNISTMEKVLTRLALWNWRVVTMGVVVGVGLLSVYWKYLPPEVPLLYSRPWGKTSW